MLSEEEKKAIDNLFHLQHINTYLDLSKESFQIDNKTIIKWKESVDKEEKDKIIEFCNKNLTEQVRILLAKYWLTHTNDEVFETFGCNYVPNIEYQNKAREIRDILELELQKKVDFNTLNKFEIKAIMGGATSYPIK